MRDRVLLLNGHLTIESRPGAGTQITAELPLPSGPDHKE
jgi:signal transduction histidine kinase